MPKERKSSLKFRYPILLMKNTCILEPMTENVNNKQYKDLYSKTQKQFDELRNSNASLRYDDFLSDLNVTEEDYIKAIRMSLNDPKVFLKRKVKESRVNAYIKQILDAWGTNLDLCLS